MDSDIVADVPVADQLRDFDYCDPVHGARSQEVLRYAREECPVAHTSATGGYYIATTYEDVSRVLRDHDTFSSTEYVNIAGSMGTRIPPIDSDPPLHHDFRKILNPFFHPKHLAEREDEVRRLARAQIGSWVDSGRCEIIGDFAAPFVTNVLAKVVFNSDDTETFHRAAECTDRLVQGDVSAFPELREVMVKFVATRSGCAPGDLMYAVLNGSVGGRPLTKDEQVGIAQILFSGGLDTTKVAISDIVLAMAQHADLEDRLRAPDWEKATLDELLRFISPIAALGRHATRDVTLGDQQLKAGDRVLVHYSSANRDATAFGSPDELVFNRERNPHLAFGLGVHRCIGLHLARLQIRVAISELLDRITGIRLVPDASLDRRPGISPVLNALHIEFNQR